MGPLIHLIVSLILAGGIFYFTNSVPAAIWSFVAGFWIDIDHFFDFWLYKKKITFDIEFFHPYHKKFGRVYLIFHSWELLLLLMVWFYFNQSVVGLGIILGMTIHMMMDFFYNPVRPLGFFLMFRIANSFKSKLIFTPDYYTRLERKVGDFKSFIKLIT